MCMYAVKESPLYTVLCVHFINYLHAFFVYIGERGTKIAVSPDVIFSELSQQTRLLQSNNFKWLFACNSSSEESVPLSHYHFFIAKLPCMT